MTAIRLAPLAITLWVFFTAVSARSEANPDAAPDQAAALGGDPPRIAIIIDDLGNRKSEGMRTVALNGPVACAVLPHTPFGQLIASNAHQAGKEVLLHLPLQAAGGSHDFNKGRIGLDNTRSQLAHILAVNLDTVPHAVGVNNHQGSLLTRHPGHMEWLMAELKSRGGLFFIDSYTTPSSIAMQLAYEHGLRTARRDVFLDNVAEPDAIAAQFRRLKRRARKLGAAIGIGHPHPVTLDFLERTLPELRRDGLVLVPLARLLTRPATAAAGAPVREPGVDEPAAGMLTAPAAH